MYVSLKDVAARAGVSFQTAGKVLNGGAATVSDETRRRIHRVAKDLGYVPNVLARSLLRQSSYTIGIIADNLEDWVLAQFVVGAEREARDHGHVVLIGAVLPETSDAESYARHLLERRVDGIIAAAPTLEKDEKVAALLRQKVPAVSMHHVPGGGVPVVGSDHKQTGRLAAEHLIELGHRRIGMICGPPSRIVVASRIRGFRAGMAGAGVRMLSRRIVEAEWTSEAGYHAALELMDRDPGISAIFAHSDLIAMGVLAALQQTGRRVPDDCAVVGCDDLPFSSHLIPPLTTIHIPFRETGQSAMALLLDSIRGAEPERRIDLPVHLVARKSTLGRGKEKCS